MPPTIALIGRTNVGKSTLFNRLIEKHKALVSPKAGTTRDRKEGSCIWRGHVIKIIDTGGLDVDKADEIEKNVIKQGELAIKQADLVLFIVDLQSGLLPQEKKLAKQLIKSKKPIIVVGNKAESPAQRLDAESKEWKIGGLPNPFAISALRGTGVGDLLDIVFDRLEELKIRPTPLRDIKATHVAVIGKPNVGKSTLLNSILGEERFITSPIAHTTREPNDVLVEFEDSSYLFIDTAGIRKSAKTSKKGGLEKAGVRQSKDSIKNADIILLVLDSSKDIGAQDRTLAGLIEDSRAGVVIVANKWDLVKDKESNTINKYHKMIEVQLPFLTWAPIHFVSALTGQRVKQLYSLIDEIEANRHRQLDIKPLDDFLKKAMKKHAPKRGKGPKPPKVYDLKQIDIAPPRFELAIRAKRKDVLHPAWVRYLENQLHQEFNFVGTPVKIQIKLPSVGAK